MERTYDRVERLKEEGSSLKTREREKGARQKARIKRERAQRK